MGISRPDIPFTYEDYKTFSASSDERHELIDGDRLVSVVVPSFAVALGDVFKNA